MNGATARLLVVALTCVALVCRCAALESPDRTVVLLLFDGWAPALLDDAPVPTLARLRREGAWTHHLLPEFPTISLVNQVSVSTGCWPEHHGIVSNEFLDPQRGRYDHSHDADWLTGCEHLHQVAERQGVRAAALGWAGRASSTRGKLATFVSTEATFADFPTDAERAAQVVDLLRLPDAERPRLILAYFRGPDAAEHFTGMDSTATRDAVAASDAAVKAILDAIEAAPFRDQTTLIVTTDHGMLPVWTNVNVARILHSNDIDAQAQSSGTSSFLYFKNREDAVDAYRTLLRYQRYFNLVLKWEQPRTWHLGQGPRVGDLILAAYPPYFIEDIHRWPWWAQWLGRFGPEFLWARPVIKASHGYLPDTPGMAGILYAWGAGIPAGHEVAKMNAVDVHPTVSRLLGIQPGTPVDGTVATGLLRADTVPEHQGTSEQKDAKD